MVARSHLTFVRIAAVGALVAVLGLAGCGRKGGLDPPPVSATSQPSSEAQPAAAPALGPDGKPVAPVTGPKQPFLLDWLVD